MRFALRSLSVAVALALSNHAAAQLQISEVMSNGSVDWFEVTNTSGAVLPFNGYLANDNDATDAPDLLNGVVSIAPGESVVFIQSTSPAANIASFRSLWGSNAATIQIGYYSGVSGGLGSADSVVLYGPSGTVVGQVNWTSHTSKVSRTFASNNQTDGPLSVSGSAGAYTSASSANIGSPGISVAGTAPGAPTANAGSGVGATGFTINWTAGSGTPTGYIVEVSTVSDNFAANTLLSAAGFSGQPAGFAVAAATTSISISGLQPNTAYRYRVRAVNGSGSSAHSGNIDVTTSGATTAQPTFGSLTNGTAYSGVVGDLSDAIVSPGISFTVSDTETPAGSLVVTVASSDTGIVAPTLQCSSGAAPTAGTCAGGAFRLQLAPAGNVGYADISVTVTDANSGTNRLQLKYGASAATGKGTLNYSGKADGSTAIALDDNYMIVADDEDNVLRVYPRTASGAPTKTFTLDTSASGLNITDASNGILREMDLEASTRVGNRLYWLASHSNSSSGSSRPNRLRLFATDVSGTGSSTALTYVGRYDSLLTNLNSWDSGNTHGKGANYFGLVASSAANKVPESSDGSGFNIEALTMAPGSSTTAYIGFRAPIVPAANRTKALVVPVTNFTSLVTANPASGPAVFGAPIELDLGGRGIRSMECNNNGCVIIAGSATSGGNFKIYTWTGNAADAPVARNANLNGLNPEGFVGLSTSGEINDDTMIQVISDNGDDLYYGGSILAKYLPYDAHKKFRSDWLRLGGVLPEITTPPNIITIPNGISGTAVGSPSVVFQNPGSGVQISDNGVLLVLGGTLTFQNSPPSGVGILLPANVPVNFVSGQGGTVTFNSTGSTVLQTAPFNPGSGATNAVDLAGGSLTIGAGSTGQVLLAILQQGQVTGYLEAGSANASLNITRDGAGRTVFVAQGSVVFRPVSSAKAGTETRLYAGETAIVNSDGSVRSVRVGSAVGSNGLVGDSLSFPTNFRFQRVARIPRVDGTLARLNGQSLSSVLSSALSQAGYGSLTLAADGSLAGSSGRWTPIGEITVDSQRSDGVTVNSDGLLEVVSSGVVVKLAPTLDGEAVAAALPSLGANATLILQEQGSFLAYSDGVAYALRAGSSATGSGSGFAVGGDGQLRWRNAGQEQRLPAAFADLATLRSTVQALGGSVRLDLDGTTRLTFGNTSYTLRPDYLLSAVPTSALGKSWWQADGKYWLRNADGSAQGFLLLP